MISVTLSLSKGAAFLAITSLLATCSAPGKAPQPEFSGVPLAPNVHCADANCRGYNVDPYIRTRSKYGIGCMGNVPPGQRIPDELPPESYLARDVGKPGFPDLRQDELRALHEIERTNTSKTLRIAWVDRGENYPRFIVFDATDGPCETWAGGYSVINGTCNEFYEPGESPYHTHPGSGCYPNDPRPVSQPTITPTP